MGEILKYAKKHVITSAKANDNNNKNKKVVGGEGRGGVGIFEHTHLRLPFFIESSEIFSKRNIDFVF